jgi:hypothetical protein
MPSIQMNHQIAAQGVATFVVSILILFAELSSSFELGRMGRLSKL